MIGLYGLVAYATGRRTREIGIRIAVGAAPRSVLAMVIRQGLVLLASGVAAGIAASTGAGRLLQAAFPIAGRIDFSTYGVVIAMIIAVTMTAVYVPARRAARVNPIAALRTE